MQGLIQSHPDPVLVQLEERYQALPPFTQAREDSPEQYIAEATVGEEVTERTREILENAVGFIPRISSTVRLEDVDNTFVNSEGAAPDFEQYTTALATVSPTFEYQRPLDRWHLKANYDYARKQYFMDRDGSLNDHNMNLNLSRRLTRGSEFSVTTRWVSTNDRTTNDPIAIGGLDLTREDLTNTRYIVNFDYKKGTLRDRSRFRLTSFNERASLDTTIAGNNWNLNENGISASYTWQAKRQFALVAEGRYARSDYDVDFRDNTHLRTLIGSDMLLWNRRLRASMKVGYESKRFNLAQGEQSFGTGVWNGDLELALRKRTKLKLSSGREIYEQLRTDEAVDTAEYNVQDWVKASWEQSWSDRFKSEIGLVYRRIDNRGRGDENRGQLLLASASYQMTNKLKLSLNSSFAREDTRLGSDFSSNAITFRTDYSL